MVTLATSYCVYVHSGVFKHCLVFINVVHYNHFGRVKARFQLPDTSELEVYIVQQILYCYPVLNKERRTNCSFKTI